MSEANKKIRDLERALRRERANVARATTERDRALSQVEELRAESASLTDKNERLSEALHLAEETIKAAEDTTVWHAAATLAPPGCPLLVRRSDGEVVEAIRPEYVRDRNPETPMGYFLLGDCKSEIHDPVEWAHR